jgi:hypothetical protein
VNIPNHMKGKYMICNKSKPKIIKQGAPQVDGKPFWSIPQFDFSRLSQKDCQRKKFHKSWVTAQAWYLLSMGNGPLKAKNPKWHSELPFHCTVTDAVFLGSPEAGFFNLFSGHLQWPSATVSALYFAFSAEFKSLSPLSYLLAVVYLLIIMQI